jgi:hypothetical protein
MFGKLSPKRVTVSRRYKSNEFTMKSIKSKNPNTYWTQSVLTLNLVSDVFVRKAILCDTYVIRRI